MARPRIYNDIWRKLQDLGVLSGRQASQYRTGVATPRRATILRIAEDAGMSPEDLTREIEEAKPLPPK